MVDFFLNNPPEVHPGLNGFEHALVQQQTCSLDRNVQASSYQCPAFLCQTTNTKINKIPRQRSQMDGN